MVVTVALPLVVALLLELARQRAGSANEPRSAPTPPAWAWGAVRAIVGTAAALYFVGTPILGAARPLLLGDASGHALVGHAIASHGLPHGWIDVVGSGFPMGASYPPLGWGIVAGLVRLGISPARAIALLAGVLWMAPPLVVVEGARSFGRRPVAALAGGLFIVLVEPYASFVGGWPVVVRMGLVSQALGTVLASLWLACALSERHPRLAGASAVLLVAAHPQIFAGAAMALVAFVVASLSRDLAWRLARSLAPASIASIALYGAGAASLSAPFGWPPGPEWLHVGLPPGKVLEWLEGGLVDDAHAPLLTAVWMFALLTTALRARDRVARGVLVSTLALAFLAVSGTTLEGLGASGRAILSVFQPLRMLAILPLLGAAAVVLAADASIELAARATTRAHRPLVVASAVLLAGASVHELVSRSSAARAEQMGPNRALAAGTCQVDGAPVPIDDELRAQLGRLEGGRLAYDWPAQAVLCARALGLEMSSSVPLARTTAVGAHVGVAWAAFGKAEAGAEALGVRWLLTRAAAERSGWETVWSRGPVALARRVGGADRIGLGCVTERWRGREDDLRREIFASLERPSVDVLRQSIELETADEPLSRSALGLEGCDATGARVASVAREPGALEATVTSPAPVDVLVRESALPAWRIEVDGVRAPYRRVAPGFMAVRVGEGTHRVVAVFDDRRAKWTTASALSVLAVVLVPRRAWARLRRLFGGLSRGASRTLPSSRPRPR